MAATLLSMGSVTVTCSTCGDLARRTIFAPKASTSYRSVSTVAPSTAVRPAIASTARPSDSCHRCRRSSGVALSNSTRAENGGDTAYGIGRTIDSRHDSVPAGTTSRAPPRLCARMETASWTSTLTESTHEAGESNPSSDVRRGGQSGRLERASSLPDCPPLLTSLLGFDPRGWRIEPEQRRQEMGAVRQAPGALVHYFDLVALQHGHVDKLARLFTPVMLDDQQPRPRHLEHEAVGRDRVSRSPHAELVSLAPNT